MVWNNLRVYLGIAGLSLLAAFAVYLFARIHPPQILAPSIAISNQFESYSGIFGSAPSFFYTLSLGLLIGICTSNRASARFHCLIWIGLALVLELSQHQVFAGPISSWTSTYLFDSIEKLIGPYWSHGIFDPTDLLATLLGGGIALSLFSHLPSSKRPCS
jgi:hypothetical protein